MPTEFKQLNHGWNAEPNAPSPEAVADRDSVTLSFVANPFQFPTFVVGQRIRIVFNNVWRYGFSDVNDEGWYRGQCRFSRIAPNWGEFYELSGDLKPAECKVDWQYVAEEHKAGSHHFLFYFRDNTFECNASHWELLK